MMAVGDGFIAAAGALGALVTGILGFALKGQIRGTDADLLWKEAGAIRDEYRAEITTLREELDQVRAELETSKSAHASCESDIGGLRRAIVGLQNDRDTLTRQVEKLESENLKLRQDNERLKKGVKDLSNAMGNGGAK